ncbi:MAG: SUMF1/EgtB/PvdO family nonheme iron enzyme, partial [Desulfuromonadales bacterium]|nr:SUMF1/EgtB/PvdO family nonheme iron enzyme [Desulfuromonadales bacterium]
RNPANDARAFAQTLRELGFAVEEQVNLGYQEMGRAIARFGRVIRRDSVALFYYAGHGLQVQGSNYLVPVDMEIQDEGEVPFNTINVGQVLAKMEEAKNPFNIVILDACRDNPFSRGWKRTVSRGLARMDVPAGSFLAYAAAPGRTADDGTGNNGLYTEALIRHIKTPDTKIEELFKRVRAEVRSRSGGRQVPEETTQLEGDFYFARGSMIVEEPPSPSTPRELAPGKLTVRSNEAGAKVYIDGVYEGETPVTATLKPGIYAILLKKAGFPDAAEKVRVEAGGARVISIVMEKPAPKAGDLYREPATGMELVFVPGGCYRMGDISGNGEADEKPVHEVCVDNFYLGKHEVTVGQFRQFVRETGHQTEAEKNAGGFTGCGALDLEDKEKPWNWRVWANWRTPNKYQENRDDHPVSCVSWNDARAFAAWLARKDGNTYRLPTEAEWEYAARAGTATRNYWGDGQDDACAYANVVDRTPLLPGGSAWPEKHECTDGYAFVAPVGRFRPNAFGLYDLIGNVWEWTEDWYGKDYYNLSPRNNPRGPAEGSARVIRGGSAYLNAGFCRSANRDSRGPGSRYNDLGFRLLRTY